MTTDWRALCAELVKELDDLRESSEGVAGFHRNGDLAPWSELGESGEFPWLSSFDRARAALAAAPEEGGLEPTHEQISQWINANPVLRPGSTGEPMIRVGTDWIAAFADAARWGARFRPAAAPVPVSERLPGPEDCNAEGRCWVHQPVDYSPEAPTWQLLFHKYASANYGTTAWLPVNALPLP